MVKKLAISIGILSLLLNVFLLVKINSANKNESIKIQNKIDEITTSLSTRIFTHLDKDGNVLLNGVSMSDIDAEGAITRATGCKFFRGKDNINIYNANGDRLILIEKSGITQFKNNIPQKNIWSPK